MYWDSTILLLIPALIFGIIAQAMVKSAYSKYSKVYNSRGITGCDAARMILDRNGLGYINIELVSGELTDHYDPKANVIRLSEGVYNSTSVAAVGIAAHETGHAVQYALGYAPIKIRSAIIPVTQIGSRLAVPIVLLGMIFAQKYIITAGILLYCAVVLFQIVTLPVEFDASARAVRTLFDYSILDEDELSGVKKVLTAAAMTYVAAMISALLSLLRLILLSNRRRR